MLSLIMTTFKIHFISASGDNVYGVDTGFDWDCPLPEAIIFAKEDFVRANMDKSQVSKIVLVDPTGEIVHTENSF